MEKGSPLQLGTDVFQHKCADEDAPGHCLRADPHHPSTNRLCEHSPASSSKKCPCKYQWKKGIFLWAALVMENANCWQGKEAAAGKSNLFPWHMGIQKRMSVCSHRLLGPTTGPQGKSSPSFVICSTRCREEVQKLNYYLDKIFLHVAEMKWVLHRSEACSLSPNGSQHCVFKMKCIKKKNSHFFWYSIPTLAFRARGCIRRCGRKPKGGWPLEGKGLRAVGSQSQNHFQV